MTSFYESQVLIEAAQRQAEALERIVELLTELVPPLKTAQVELDPDDECGDCFGMYHCTLKPGHDGRHAYAVGGRLLMDWSQAEHGPYTSSLSPEPGMLKSGPVSGPSVGKGDEIGYG